MGFGERLRELREGKGLTQEELAKKINQKKANISKYETGKLQPSLETLDFLADFFGVTTDYLLDRGRGCIIPDSIADTLDPITRAIGAGSSFTDYSKMLALKMGKSLKLAREAKNLTPEQVCKNTGIDIKALAQYENGTKMPSPEEIKGLADFFEVSIDYLYGRTDDPTPPKLKKEPSYVGHVLSAPALPEALIRIANLLKRGKIDIEIADHLSDLAFDKFGVPQSIDNDEAYTQEEASHNEIDIPGTGVLGDTDDDDKNGKQR